MPDTAVLEISRLEEIFEEDTSGIADLLEAAMGTGETLERALLAAMERQSLGDVMKAAHAIRGSASNIGGNDVAAIAARIELAARADSWAGIAADARELSVGYGRLRAAVTAYRMSIS